MDRSTEPVSSSFESIRGQLNPAYGYMIFERRDEPNREAHFQQVFDALGQIDLNVHSREYFRDEARGTLLLVVGFDPGQTNKIMEEFLSIGLPEGVTFYAYDSPKADGG
jgi:hypothetical protein